MAAVSGHILAATVLLLLISTASSDPSDELCLTHLHQSFTNTNTNLQNWTKSTFSNPCNGFTSFLQGATCNNGRIYKLNLPNLSLSGSISPFISNCTNLQTLDLSSNSLTGAIPVELQYLVNLAVLNLSYNDLNGQIPPQLAMCAYLNVIDLHRNELSGPIPQQLGLLVRLSVFDASDNRLTGVIPPAIGRRFNLSSFKGNRGLYGYPMKEMKENNKGGLSVMEIVGIGLASGFGSLAVSFTAVCVWLRLTEKRLLDEDGDDRKVNIEGMPDY